jgi:hypothetical protein
MHIAIKFHDDPHFIAEVDDVVVDWNLSTDFRPCVWRSRRMPTSIVPWSARCISRDRFRSTWKPRFVAHSTLTRRSEPPLSGRGTRQRFLLQQFVRPQVVQEYRHALDTRSLTLLFSNPTTRSSGRSSRVQAAGHGSTAPQKLDQSCKSSDRVLRVDCPACAEAMPTSRSFMKSIRRVAWSSSGSTRRGLITRRTSQDQRGHSGEGH